MGYARGRCPRYSCDGAGDAVRFLISNDQAGLVRIEYVVERDHHPHQRGSFEYHRAAAILDPPTGNPQLDRQALAFISSYLRRTAVA